MSIVNPKTAKRIRRHNRIRARVSGTAAVPRLAVFRSNTAVYGQLIDDVKGVTLASSDTRKASGENTRAKARAAGAAIAALAKGIGIERVVFDRGGFLYTGVVREFAEGAREGGLVF